MFVRGTASRILVTSYGSLLTGMIVTQFILHYYDNELSSVKAC